MFPEFLGSNSLYCCRVLSFIARSEERWSRSWRRQVVSDCNMQHTYFSTWYEKEHLSQSSNSKQNEPSCLYSILRASKIFQAPFRYRLDYWRRIENQVFSRVHSAENVQPLKSGINLSPTCVFNHSHLGTAWRWALLKSTVVSTQSEHLAFCLRKFRPGTMIRFSKLPPRTLLMTTMFLILVPSRADTPQTAVFSTVGGWDH